LVRDPAKDADRHDHHEDGHRTACSDGEAAGADGVVCWRPGWAGAVHRWAAAALLAAEAAVESGMESAVESAGAFIILTRA